MLSYKRRRQKRKALIYSEMYGGGQMQQARTEGSYPPVYSVDLADVERRLLAGRDPFGEDG